MRYQPSLQLKDNDVTSEAAFLSRRQFISGAAGTMAAMSYTGAARASGQTSGLGRDLTPNSWDDITTYNNYYEFGLRKSDPATYAQALSIDPWSVRIDGEVERPGTYPLEDLIAQFDIEERIYRLRCVEAWSMVIPWDGFMLRDLLTFVGVKSSGRYVAFETALRPDEMIGLEMASLDWPYTEGLRIDEAMHPLTLMATGLYGKDLPKQNGAPMRLVVPWKYGFKSGKSITRIVVTKTQPNTAWSAAAPNEYGFYANVNPNVDHPRWSQASERVIGSGLFAKRRPTDMFNGYGADVASLYSGMDLAVHY